jgi:hypothetical protein
MRLALLQCHTRDLLLCSKFRELGLVAVNNPSRCDWYSARSNRLWVSATVAADTLGVNSRPGGHLQRLSCSCGR